jgi:hypothetical protein
MPESGLSESGDGRLLEREGRLRLEKMTYAFSKFTKYFLSNENYFQVDYYFRPHQIPENVENIF